jgi:hypothetical protein
MFTFLFKCFSLYNNDNNDNNNNDNNDKIIIKNKIKYIKHLTTKQIRRLKRKNRYNK